MTTAMEQFGTDAIKDALLVGMNFTDKIIAAKADDGKIDKFEWVGIGFSGLSFISVVKNAKAIKNEFSDLSVAERTALVDWFAEEFNIPNDEVEGYVELAFAFVLSLSELVAKREAA